MEIPKYRAWVTGTENIMYQPREVWINNGEVWLSNTKGLPGKKVAADKVILSRHARLDAKTRTVSRFLRGISLKSTIPTLRLTMIVLVSLCHLSKRYKKIKSIRISLSF